MCGSWPQQDHPFLDDLNCVETSDIDPLYNCIAWAAGETHRWWWPSLRRGISYWPLGVDRVATIPAFIHAYQTVGFQECANGDLDPGIEKIVLFARADSGILIPTHAAKQLESGSWSSKMGPLEDICHTVAGDPRGPLYGNPVRYMARPRPASTNI